MKNTHRSEGKRIGRRTVVGGISLGATTAALGGGISALAAPPAEPGGNGVDGAEIAAAPPGNIKVYNVKSAPYNAVGNGVADDTAAIKKAIAAILDAKRANFPNVRSTGHHTLYFPAGTYLVKQPLTFGGTDRDQVLQMGIHVLGEGPGSSVIRLADNTFTQPGSPQILLSLYDSKASNKCFVNTVEDIGFHTGSGNTGAIGLRFHNNNVGAVRRVTVTSGDGKGVTGLDLGTWLAGIGVVTDLKVTGFDYGVSNVNNEHVGYVLERIELSGQKVAGIRTRQKGLWVRSLTSDNSVPAVKQEGGGGQTVVLNSRLRGGASGASAIDSGGGWLFVRGVTVEGYGNGVRDGSVIRKGSIGEYVTGGARRLFDDAPTTSINLNIADPPEVNPTPRDEWAVVNGTDGAAIQAAIDSGASCVLIPRGRYTLSQTLRVRRNVNRIIGDWSSLAPSAALVAQETPVILIEDGSAPTVIIEQLDSAFGADDGKAWYFQTDTTRNVVLRDLFLPYGPAYRHNAAGGRLFIENVCSGGATSNYRNLPGWAFGNQSVWARHLNHEGTYPHMTNEGGTVFVLGAKFGEQYGPYVRASGGGRTEIIGAVFNTLNRTHGRDDVAFINVDSDAALVALERSTTKQGTPMNVTIREARGSDVRELPAAQLPQRTGNDLISPAVPLYRGDSRGA